MIVQPFDLGVPGLFVTGTDTGVGKTLVAGALAAAAHDCGVRVGVMKPVESGCQRRDGRLVPGDAVFLREMARSGASLDLVNPYAMQHALAPALAAELEGVPIDLARIELCYRTLAAEYAPVIVEGAGGLLTPLSGGLTMRDLAVMLRLPVLVVARNTLGALNHTMLTVQSARQAGLDVIGIVLNRPAFVEDDATRTNATALRRWGGAPLIGEIPFLPSLDRGILALRGIDLASQIGASRARTQGRQVRRTTGREFRRRGGRIG
jgi:dethiobiotin synthetase